VQGAKTSPPSLFHFHRCVSLLTTPFVISNQAKKNGSKIKTRQMRHFGIVSGWWRGEELLVCVKECTTKNGEFFSLLSGEKLWQRFMD
jgi:hypothetical protein